ncbi:hypothetical protein MUB24_12790 [Lederbergia sp. NSJ-179]|uniref:hypothetical protein n=1 Tax=Lederbergia sp. NSJ-179 TaxID=2931402 RepID=UPI001FD56BAB|nr:hypothetical protein [Lederbergia sp. NSJ-179]MCJ7841759.1 hypothetical protein [Lederbergia sp. NSJ-179]
MNNLQHVEMETKGIELSQQELIVYLQENGLNPHEAYQADSHSSKKAICQTALSILESVANNPELMKNIKLDDMTVSEFHDNLTKRIDQLTRKIRGMRTDKAQSDIFFLFR